MGFRKGAWMSVFGIEKKSDKIASIQGATSHKRGDSYETDFSAFCSLVGEGVVKKAMSLSPAPTKEHPVRIRLGDVEVKQNSVNNNGQWTTYNNFNIYDFDLGEDLGGKTPAAKGNSAPTKEDQLALASEGITDDVDEEGLPF